MRNAARALVVVVALLMPAILIGVPVASAQAPTGSAVTKSGIDGFAGLKVTVAQTTGLINQTVAVTWTGGAPTPGFSGTALPGNFLEVMQCWGDDPTGPDRTQCQWGGGTGYAVGTRKLVPNTPPAGGAQTVYDPEETYPATVPDEPYFSRIIPFWPVGGTKPTTSAKEDLSNPYFDQQSTNEVPIARTRPDGTGEVDFEMQTRLEAPGLGCGAPVEAGGVVTGRSCWLVVVPRGLTEPNGLPAGVGGLSTSPLLQTNWDKRISFKLGFLPQGQACPLGAAEQGVTGHELVVDAVSSWQPTLCAGGGALFSFTQLSDDLTRQRLTDDPSPGLTVLSDPVPAPPPDRPIVYAPLAVSGLAIAFRIVRNPSSSETDPTLLAGRGSPFLHMKLNPRLVAKLLTQSYRGSVAPPPAVADPSLPAPTVPATNPVGLTNDPEFLALNSDPTSDSDYSGRLLSNLYIDTLVQAGTSDLTGQLWNWVLGDAKARAFLNGVRDPTDPTDTTVVNSANKGPTLPLTTYPRNDAFCVTESAGTSTPPFTAKYCSSDARSYTNNMHESGRAASRGDQFGNDPGLAVVSDGRKFAFPKYPRQQPEQQATLAVVDLATANRYGLQTASLLNASGAYVAPDQAGLAAGLAAMKPSGVPGVLQPDPTTTNAAAYPLTAVSYAAAAPSRLTADAGKSYASFLRYAAGAGQVQGQQPGQLPLGYLPLTATLRQQTLAAAATIASQAGKAVGASPTPVPPPAPTPPPAVAAIPPGTTGGSGSAGTGSAGTGSAGTGSAGTSGSAGAGGSGTSATPPAAPAPAGAGAAATPAAKPAATPAVAEPVAQVLATPALPAPAVGALLEALLIGGGLVAAMALATHLLSIRRRPAEGGDAADRTGPRRVIAWPSVRPALVARRR